MLEALPNLHAAVLHGPIVLLPLAVAVQIAVLARRQDQTLAVVSVASWILATASAALTFVAGRWAADGLMNVDPEAMLRVGEHADHAWWVLAVSVVALVAKLGGVAAGKHVAGKVLAWLALGFGVVVLPLLVWTADAGGALVYDYGLAVRLPPVVCPEAEPCPDAAPIATLSTVDNTLTFVPAAEDRPFTSFDDPNTGGLVVVTGGQQTLLLDGNWDDVQVNAWLDLSGFQGTVSLLHHVGERSGAFAFGPEGAALVGPDGAVLDRSDDTPPPSGAFAVNVAGNHLKGLVDGRTVVHGHGDSGAAGAVGIAFVGTGDVVIRRIEAIRMQDH